MIVIKLIFIFLFYLIIEVNSIDNSKDCFRAAVYEHVQQGRDSKDPHYAINLNLQVFEHVAEKSASNGVNVLVLPEGGLFIPGDTRAETRQYLEDIPNPTKGIIYNPCENPNEYEKSRPALYRLSCAARKNNLYIAADVGDVQKCSNSTDCPKDGVRQYNTAILFDNKGNLIAKYHKTQLFGEMTFDVPKPEEVYVDTPFGRLGMFICFDILWKLPAMKLIHELNITTVLYPTWWLDYLPFLSATQNQQAYAITNGINLLAADIMYPQAGTVGSGIYAGKRGAVLYSNTPDGLSKLLIADVPIYSNSGKECKSNSKVITIDTPFHFNRTHLPEGIFHEEASHGYVNMFMDNVDTYLLTKPKDSITKCNNGLCCNLNYTLKSNAFTNDEKYYLILSNRTTGLPFKMAEEFCGLVRCDPNKDGNCTAFRVIAKNTLFENIAIKAKFSTPHVYPSVMMNNFKLFPHNQWQFTNSSEHNQYEYKLMVGSMNESLLTFGMYGRCYNRDPPYQQRNPFDFRNNN